MEWYYLFLVIILLLLAIYDLSVGVANDAVNFLNSAYGSRVVKLKTLLIIASVALIIGAVFGSGMMDVARKGIFNPQMFTFHQVMIIFVVMMFSDIILLDYFNTYGLPTSTTVSMVFNLLGASFGVAIGFFIQNSIRFNEITNYINVSSTLTIIIGIFTSIIVAFIFGYIVQFIVRLIFSYNYLKVHKVVRALFNAICIVVITYFIFLKGINSLPLINEQQSAWLFNHISLILLIIGLVAFIILYILESIRKYNSFNISILYGAFALAMSFASNDLVNFIGVPLAGLSAFQIFSNTGGADPNIFTMEGLLNPSSSNSIIYLLIAGVIMSITLFRNKKLKTVMETEIRLGKQEETTIERFSVNAFGRMLVDVSYHINKLFAAVKKTRFHKWLNNRFDTQYMVDKDAPFDKVRATVNLMVASSLIALGTSLKLPLSTTYVTFIVAMSTALADRAWGRDSAVYRISGVVNVVGGWFLTALFAFTLATLLGLFIHFTNFVGILIIIIIAVFSRINSDRKHRQISKKLSTADSISSFTSKADVNTQIIIYEKIVFKLLNDSSFNILESLKKEKISILKDSLKNYEKIKTEVSSFRTLLPDMLTNIKGLNTDEYQYFLTKIEHLDQILDVIYYIINPTMLHLQNHHKPLTEFQIEQLKRIFDIINNISDIIIDENKELNDNIVHLLEMEIVQVRRNLIAVSLSDDANTKMPRRATILVYNILNECDNLVRILYSFTENNYKKAII